MSIRLAVVSDYPDRGESPVGGVQVPVTRLVRALSEAGVDVTVIAPRRGSAEQLASRPGIIHVPMEARWALPRRLRMWRAGVRHALAELSPDIAHAHGVLPSGIALGGIHAPRVLSVYGNPVRDTLAAYRGPSGWARAVLRHRLSIAALRNADVVVGTHPEWRWNLPREPSRFLYIPPAIDDRFFGAVRRPNGRSVLYCGGPRRIKGWDVLAAGWAEVAKRVGDARLVVAGWSASAPPRLLAHLPESSVQVHSWVSSDRILELMESASALVVPSRFEVAPSIVVEAWAAGVPVVATAVGGLPAFAAGAAIVVPPDDPSALAQGVVEALSGGASIDALVAEGRARAEAFRADSVARKHLDLYEELLAA